MQYALREFSQPGSQSAEAGRLQCRCNISKPLSLMCIAFASFYDSSKRLLNLPAPQSAWRTFAAGFEGAKIKDVMDKFSDRGVLIKRRHSAMSYSCPDACKFFEP